MKSLCGLYGRPKGLDEDGAEAEDKPAGGVISAFMAQTSDDVWKKIAKSRPRREPSDAVKNKAAERQKFPIFSQLTIRNEVLEEVKDKFLQDLKRNINAPLPPELFLDNRSLTEPHYNKGENPPQGPFWWHEEEEKPATEEEELIINAYLQGLEELKEQQLELQQAGRHPYEPVELDWIEEGCEMSATPVARKTPIVIQKLPEFVMNLDPKSFEKRFQKMVNETAEDLVGSQMYEVYKRKRRGRPSFIESDIDFQLPDEEDEPIIPTCKSQIMKLSLDPEADDISNSDEDEEEEEEVKENIDYIYEEDLEEAVTFPLPNVRFSSVDFPADDLPETVLEEITIYNHGQEKPPVEKKMEEHKALEEALYKSSSSSDNDEEEADEEEAGEDSAKQAKIAKNKEKQREALEAALTRHKPFKKRDTADLELDIVGLRHIFIDDTYMRDVEQMEKKAEENKGKEFSFFD